MRTAKMPALGERRSGVLLHPTSLPGPHGCGDLGAAAHRFVDFLAESGQSWWQMLPVGPVGYGNSPYMAMSAFAGDTRLISLDVLHEEGLLDSDDLTTNVPPDDGRVRFEEVAALREPLLRKAAARFLRRREESDHARFHAFCSDHQSWLDDYALFLALRREFGNVSWTGWDEGLRDRRPEALEAARKRLKEEIDVERFLQYEFARQWSMLRDKCRVRGIGLVGDIPVFVAHESVDVWANRDLFFLDETGLQTVVAGVPPDYFSKTGQRWGHPLYRWDRLRERGYGWWISRFRRTLGMFDAVRIDHFIGFQRYWEIPASCETAVDGRYVDGPGADFFQVLESEIGRAPIIAEDLGAVTPEVVALRDQFGFPGMRVLQFAFGGDFMTNDHLPHLYPSSSVVYTGTHDNETTVGWYRALKSRVKKKDPGAPKELAQLTRYVGGRSSQIHWDLIRLAQMSVADLAVTPMQDLLGLGSEARMNTPSHALGNWAWRLKEGQMEGVAERLRELTETYGRMMPGRVENGELRIENGELRMENGEWRTESEGVKG